ncbi:MAG: DUF6036 family nucleotidyltransferase [Chloroflexota bacterium]
MSEREPATVDRIELFLRQLGQRYRGAGRIYLVGGTQMVLAGFRRQTDDIDYVVRLEHDDGDFISAVRSLIRDLNLSVESAGKGDFIPLPAGWEERSPFIARYGRLDAFAFDPVSTSLAKIERGAARDTQDVLALVHSGIVDLETLRAALDEIAPRLEHESIRVDERDFRRKFEAFVLLAKPEWGAT